MVIDGVPAGAGWHPTTPRNAHLATVPDGARSPAPCALVYQVGLEC